MTPQGSAPTDEPLLDITIRSAAGGGRTLLSAFDAALLSAGVANFNLIRLSSVIPRASRLRHTTERLPGEHGDRLFAVWAAGYAEHPGETAWAGLGWVRDEAGHGLFVEHHGGSEDEVLELVHLSLEDLTAGRGGGYGPPETVVASAHYEGRPACALALAAYQVMPWRNA
jgi:arginine decarboxylase